MHDGLKKPLAASLNLIAQQQVADAIAAMGKALPCHVVSIAGQIVSVAFDVDDPTVTLPTVTMPIATSQYDWLPLQEGDKGLTVPSDVYLGGVSGLGGGTASATNVGNLSALVFLPVANASWSTTFEGYRLVQGPEGAVLQTLDGSVSLVLNSAGVTINGNLVVTGDTSFGGGAKKVVLDGDPVSGGTVHATSTTMKGT